MLGAPIGILAAGIGLVLVARTLYRRASGGVPGSRSEAERRRGENMQLLGLVGFILSNGLPLFFATGWYLSHAEAMFYSTMAAFGVPMGVGAYIAAKARKLL